MKGERIDVKRSVPLLLVWSLNAAYSARLVMATTASRRNWAQPGTSAS